LPLLLTFPPSLSLAVWKQARLAKEKRKLGNRRKGEGNKGRRIRGRRGKKEGFRGVHLIITNSYSSLQG
jgi:hypothetical protein